MRLISQLLNGFSRVLRKLRKYSSGTIVLTAFVPLYPVKPVIFCLYLNEAMLLGKSPRVPAAVKSC